MNPTTDMDRMILAWLAADRGSLDSTGVETAIASTRPMPQRRGLFGLGAAAPWPRTGMDVSRRRWAGVAVVALALVVSVMTAALIGNQLVKPLPITPPPTAEPSGTPAMNTQTPTPLPSPTEFVDAPRTYANVLEVGVPLLMPMAEPLLVPLLDDRVLIFGNNIAEIYEPDTGAQTEVQSYIVSGDPSATMLADGRVLVIGLKSPGTNATDGVITQLFDPATGSFTSLAPMVTPRQGELAVALTDGRALIDGGVTSIDGPDIPLTAAEMFDPTSMTFASTDLGGDFTSVATMTKLGDGRVLVTGGRGERWPNHTTQATGRAGAVIFNPASGAPTGTSIETGQPLHRTSIAVGDGRGRATFLWGDDTAGIAGIDEWDLLSGTFTASFTDDVLLPAASSAGRVLALDDGRLLITVHYDTFMIRPNDSVRALPARSGWNPAAVLLADGRVMIAGGRVDNVYHPNALGNGGAPAPVDTVMFFR